MLLPLAGRIDYNPPIPRVPLRFTLGCALLRLQRVLDNVFSTSR